MSQRRIVLLGEHISGSLSPKLHNTLFRRYGLPFIFELAPAPASGLHGLLAALKEENFRGANVTSPHKQILAGMADELQGDALQTGAVNCLVYQDGVLSGHNTDVTGFAGPLHRRLPPAPFTAAVMGTGGAALAALYVLLNTPGLAGVVQYSRNPGVPALPPAIAGHPRLQIAGYDAFRPADILVNATTSGMKHNPAPILQPDQFAGVRLYYDMVYNPARTAMMDMARRSGAEITGGVDMFAGQAAESFRLWTGILPDAVEVASVLHQVI